VTRFVREHKGTPLPKGKKEARKALLSHPAAPHDDFLQSYEWRRLRMEVLVERGAKCECCGISPKEGAVMNVDHIKPRLRFPHLKLEKSNLQVLCAPCNHGKGNWDETDWRADKPEPSDAAPVVVRVARPETKAPDPTAPRLVRKAG
jgi:5-methylcytosine-specific restriction endonuclease McrA